MEFSAVVGFVFRGSVSGGSKFPTISGLLLFLYDGAKGMPYLGFSVLDLIMGPHWRPVRMNRWSPDSIKVNLFDAKEVVLGYGRRNGLV